MRRYDVLMTDSQGEVQGLVRAVSALNDPDASAIFKRCYVTGRKPYFVELRAKDKDHAAAVIKAACNVDQHKLARDGMTRLWRTIERYALNDLARSA